MPVPLYGCFLDLYGAQYMVILFLLFVVQFSVACACLAMTEDQERELARQGWEKAPSSARAQAERLFRCCGFERNASYPPDVVSQCQGIPTCCNTPEEVRCPRWTTESLFLIVLHK